MLNQNKDLNVPNLLTCSRIALAFIFSFLLFMDGFWAKFFALVTFLVASFTDYLDGYIARKEGSVTNFGKLMDPIADKMLTLSAFIGFSIMKILPIWMVILIIVRDFLITGLRLRMPEGSSSQEARVSGKQKTALQFAAIVLILIYIMLREATFWKFEWEQPVLSGVFILMLFIVAVTLWSGLRYIFMNRKMLNRSV